MGPDVLAALFGVKVAQALPDTRLSLDYRDGGPAWRAWRDGVKAKGGAVVVWPFATGIYGRQVGRSAAKYEPARYAQLYNAGQIDLTAPTQTGGGAVYVLAPGDAADQAPQAGLTTLQSAVNATGTALDRAATTLGLGDFGRYAKWALVILVALVAFSIYSRIQRS